LVLESYVLNIVSLEGIESWSFREEIRPKGKRERHTECNSGQRRR
jgi:hypothetical protein